VTPRLPRAAAGAPPERIAPARPSLPGLLLALALAALAAGCSPANDPSAEAGHEAGQDHGGEAMEPEGPHGGHLFTEEGFTLEAALAETEAGAEFRLYATRDGAPVPPADLTAALEVRRITGAAGGRVERFAFAPAGEYLASTARVAEPHSFDVTVAVRHAGRDYRFEYASPEGLVTIDPAMAKAQGVTTATAGPGMVRETLTLYGSIEAVPDRVRSVQARFPGIVRGVDVGLGDRVARGQRLATVESNDTLQTYAVTAPIGGTITARSANPGEATAGPLFTITDLSKVHADLTVFPRDRQQLKPGQRLEVQAADGDARSAAELEYLVPGMPGSQALLAHVELDNATGLWSPGQFVTARVVVREAEAAVAVPLEAIQTWREWESVFVVDGDRYQVQPVRLGRRDDRHVEVLEGLAPGATFVVGNSYLVKADIEKSGAAHDH
jgi:cobalt-zinc-cadmium efflux system membrane fusion protein